MSKVEYMRPVEVFSTINSGITTISDEMEDVKKDISKNNEYIKNLERLQRRKCWINSRYKKR